MKFWTGLIKTINPIKSVKKPGVINKRPETNKKIPPLISSVGIIPWERFFCASNKSFIP